MHIAKLPIACAAVLLLGGVTGCSTFGQGVTGADSSSPVQVGGAEWWADNKDLAVFVPGKGYSVPDTPGFFDEFGRPMDGGLQPGAATDRSTLVSYESTPDEVGLLGDLAPTSTFDKIKNSFGPDKSREAAQTLYDEGETLFRDKQYDDAVAKFVDAAKRWPDSPLEEQAMFMQAEALFFADHYPDANDGYNALVKKYVNTQFLDKVVTRQFAIARFWEQHHRAEPHWPTTPNLLDDKRHLFDTKGHALKTYENIRLNDPTGPLADDALLATANSHFLSGRYGDADYYFGVLRKEYPQSDYQYQAHLLGLQCKLLRYQGPDYDQTPLVEARQLVEQLLAQFAEDLGDDRQRILEIRQQLAASLAHRDWKLAQFYEGKSEYGAARYYYEQLIREYPTTRMAEQARVRIGTIADEPAVPPERFVWLEDLLPTNRKETIMMAQPIDDPLRR